MQNNSTELSCYLIYNLFHKNYPETTNMTQMHVFPEFSGFQAFSTVFWVRGVFRVSLGSYYAAYATTNAAYGTTNADAEWESVC